MSYKKVSLILFLVLAGFGIWSLVNVLGDAGHSGATPSLASGSSFLPFDYIKEEPTIQEELSEAKARALTWRGDASLVAISMRFADGLGYDFLSHYNYVFQSPTESRRYLIVSNPRISGQVEQTYGNSDLFDNTMPGGWQEEFMKINFVQALEIVERSGGYSFRIDHPNDYTVTLLLIRPESAVLSWYVSYADGANAEEQSWQVNATSGVVEAQ